MEKVLVRGGSARGVQLEDGRTIAVLVLQLALDAVDAITGERSGMGRTGETLLVGPDLRPRPCPPFTPQTPAEQRRWAAALVRREQRLQRVKRLKATIVNDSSGERR